MNKPMIQPVLRVTTRKIPGSLFVRFQTDLMPEPGGQWEQIEAPVDCHRLELAKWLSDRQQLATTMDALFVRVDK